MSIAGTDPTGGAGIQADLKSFAAMRCHGMAAITAVVAQNTQGVRSFVALDPDFVGAQIDAVFEDVRVDAVKIGMIATAGIAEIVADRLMRHRATNIVLDPVMVATSGDALIDAAAADAVRNLLVPLADLITPNLSEAAVLLGCERARTLEEMRAQLTELARLGSRTTLLKGGHLDDADVCVDLLIGPGDVVEFGAPRIRTTADHGTGCTLSAAIAALIATRPLEDAVREAKAYLQAALAAGHKLDVGKGHGPVHHFHELWP